MSQGCHKRCFYYSDWCFRKDCRRQTRQHALRPALSPTPMSLFPTLGSLQEVADLADSKLPITSKNELFSLLATYHNTLLNAVQRSAF
jgi:hypothetical protein